MSGNEQLSSNIGSAIWALEQSIKSLESVKDANPVVVGYYLVVAQSHAEQAHKYIDNAVGWNKDPFSGVK